MPREQARERSLGCPWWCARCDFDGLDGYHVSAPLAVIEHDPGADEVTVVVALERWDCRQLDLNAGPGRWIYGDVAVRMTFEPAGWGVDEVSYSAQTARRVAQAMLAAARLADELNASRTA